MNLHLSFNARVFRIILGVMILLLAIACAAALYFAAGFLRDNVTATTRAKIDAEISNSNIQVLDQLERSLALPENKSAAAKARSIIGTTEDYKYQDQFIQDIINISNQTGVGITGFTFPAPSGTGTAVPTTGATGGAAGTAATPGVALPAGVKPLLVTINTSSPLPYENYLRFVRALELNLTRLQVTGVTIAPDAEKPGQITNSSIGVQIYIRQ